MNLAFHRTTTLCHPPHVKALEIWITSSVWV